MNTKQVRKVINSLGGVSATARMFGVSRQAVLKWTQTRVPAERAAKLARLAGVSPSLIRPDVFDP